MRVAVLGLGLMGSAIATRLHERGWAVVGWNRSPGPAQSLADRGLETRDRAADAIESAEVGLLVLSDAAAIAETLFATPMPLAGRTLIQMGTIAPDESRDLAHRAADAGAGYLEAPVLGSRPEALAGRLLVMVGGPPDLVERCRPLLAALSERPERIGDVGQAAALKLALNQLIAGLTASFALSLGLVRREGIAVEQFMTLLRGSALYAPTFDKKLDKYLTQDFGSANFSLKHLLKDLRLFHAAADKHGLDTATVGAIESAVERGLENDLGDQDYSALYQILVPTRTPPR
ncbi:NAD(P)-dependent oxidoreductase [Thioalkalicoccus limnaeus]|uniref:NAD(P)-dependent oxidoreductase n=1 Tax=Thioalkalicoccus limnaeus TaxID=120681 RepID=A0ABV4B9Y1_9GAMM